MKSIKTVIYRGPNRYTPFSILHLRVDLGALAALSTGRLDAGFADRLTALLPGLGGDGEGEDFTARMKKGVPLAEVIVRAAVELQRMVGFPVTFGEARRLNQSAVYDLLIDYQEAAVGRNAGELALRLVESLVPEEYGAETTAEEPTDIKSSLRLFVEKARELCLDPASAALVQAAKGRDIPLLYFQAAANTVIFGQGCFQKRVQNALTSDTRALNFSVARGKGGAMEALARLGLPLPRQTIVPSADEAVSTADSMGFPLLIWPKNGPDNQGIVVRWNHPRGVGTAFREVEKEGHSVVLENFLEGTFHRFLVIGDRVAAALRYDRVVGKGNALAQLVEAQRHPKRWRVLKVDEKIHPDNLAVSVLAVGSLGLDIAEVTLLIPDIGCSYTQVGGRILDLRPSPDLNLFSPGDEAQKVAEAMMDMLYPPGAPGRIPIAAVTGTNGKTTTCRMLAHILQMAGYKVGLSSTMGIYIGGTMVEGGDRAGSAGANIILSNPLVEAAVLETARGGLIKGGMGYDACNVSAVLNIAEDHLGLDGIETVEQMAEVKRIIVTGARDAVVLNADDPLCVPMAEHTTAEQICYFSLKADNPVVKEHIAKGRPAVVFETGAREGRIVFYENGTASPLMSAHEVPVTFGGRALFNVQNAMAAAALAHFLKIPSGKIRTALSTFVTSFEQSGGRLNVYDKLPFQVILDYAHNVHGFERMVETLEKFPYTGRRIGVFRFVGRHADENYFRLGRIVAGKFDHYIFFQSERWLGRQEGETSRLFGKALSAAGVEEDRVTFINAEKYAVDRALTMARPGDQVMIFATRINRTWDQITSFKYKGGIQE